MQTLDLTLEPEPLRRVEVLTGVGRRRNFSPEFKAQVLSETSVPGAVVSHVARRHGLTPQQVFTWRRELRSSEVASPTPAFASVLIEAPAAAPHAQSMMLEITICGASVRIPPGADVQIVATILRALRADT